jgi:hypothetical protein
MFFLARRTLGRAWFKFNRRGLRNIPPLDSTDTSLTLVSMVVRIFCGSQRERYVCPLTPVHTSALPE